MPIYAYKCSSCQHEQDVLRKVSDPPLSICPACGAPTFAKQLTAAGFHLKGSGWYATDFKNGSPRKSADGKKADGASANEAASEGAQESAKKGAQEGAKKAAGGSATESSTDAAASKPASDTVVG
ncbi:MAG TPA: zinc ribbon domain-containing protein [Burkholderiaceae bacterium]